MVTAKEWYEKHQPPESFTEPTERMYGGPEDRIIIVGFIMIMFFSIAIFGGLGLLSWRF